MKSEPSVFSIEDLKNSPGKTTFWNGVRNYQARNFLRDEIKKGDKVIFYHSNAEPAAAVGVCEVVKNGYPDHTAFDPDSKYFDPKSSPDKPTWFMVDIKLKSIFKKPVDLEKMRNNTKLKNMKLLQRGNRLSVLPLTKEEFETMVKMGE
jgi:predicted RNA-binding protein with PUA-like domain